MFCCDLPPHGDESPTPPAARQPPSLHTGYPTVNHSYRLPAYRRSRDNHIYSLLWALFSQFLYECKFTLGMSLTPVVDILL